MLAPETKPDATRDLLAKHRSLLLVLDHLISSETAHRFISVCVPDGLPVLSTSRSRHAVFNESIPIRELAAEDTEALFRDRAELSQGDNLVAEICRTLDYHPLALTIAAARVKTEELPLSRLLPRLADEKTRLRALRVGENADRDRNVWASLNLSYRAWKFRPAADLHVVSRVLWRDDGSPAPGQSLGPVPNRMRGPGWTACCPVVSRARRQPCRSAETGA